MTKQEIIESLKNTKVYVNGKSAEIQKKLFELGFKWCGVNKAIVQITNAPFLTINGIGIQWMNNMGEFTELTNKEVTADYILNLTWEDDKPKFQPFDKVLMRDSDLEHWLPRCYHGACDASGNEIFDQIIPYEGNEHLAWTTNKPE